MSPPTTIAASPGHRRAPPPGRAGCRARRRAPRPASHDGSFRPTWSRSSAFRLGFAQVVPVEPELREARQPARLALLLPTQGPCASCPSAVQGLEEARLDGDTSVARLSWRLLRKRGSACGGICLRRHRDDRVAVRSHAGESAGSTWNTGVDGVERQDESSALRAACPHDVERRRADRSRARATCTAGTASMFSPSPTIRSRIGIESDRRVFDRYLAEIDAEAERARSLYDLLVLPGLELTYDDPDPLSRPTPSPSVCAGFVGSTSRSSPPSPPRGGRGGAHRRPPVSAGVAAGATRGTAAFAARPERWRRSSTGSSSSTATRCSAGSQPPGCRPSRAETSTRSRISRLEDAAAVREGARR